TWPGVSRRAASSSRKRSTGRSSATAPRRACRLALGPARADGHRCPPRARAVGGGGAAGEPACRARRPRRPGRPGPGPPPGGGAPRARAGRPPGGPVLERPHACRGAARRDPRRRALEPRRGGGRHPSPRLPDGRRHPDAGEPLHAACTPPGAGRAGCVGPSQWEATAPLAPDLGPTPHAFARRFRTRFGVTPDYPAAQAYAAGLIMGRCIEVAGGLDRERLHAAATSLEVTTL